MSKNNFGADDAFACGGILFIGGLILILLATVGLGLAHAFHVEVKPACVVVDKDRGAGNGDMRVYTENCGVLIVADDTLTGQWNSADTYQRIEPGKTYDLTTRGYRIGWLSMFPKVIEVRHAED